MAVIESIPYRCVGWTYWTKSKLDCKGRVGVWAVKCLVNKGFFPLLWIEMVW